MITPADALVVAPTTAGDATVAVVEHVRVEHVRVEHVRVEHVRVEHVRVERVLVARIGEERIALDVLAVREVLDAPAVTPVPLAPAGLCGQMAYRGGVLPILDPQVLLGMPMRGAAGAVLVLADVSVALAVDDVEDVWTLVPEDRHAVPAGTDQRGVLRALLRRGDCVVAQVDVAALVTLALATLRQELMP